jgi:hypothetical protein
VIRPSLRLVVTVALASVVLRPAALRACSACFSESDSPLANGMNWGIFSLLAVVVCVLSGVASFFVYLGRRSGTVTGAAAPAAAEPAPKP